MSEKYPFLETIEAAVASLDQKPQFGAPPFPMKELEKALQSRFQLPDLKITSIEKGWIKEKPKGELLTLNVSSINTPFYWNMTKKDEGVLFQTFFSMDEEASYFLEKPLAQGLFQFVAVSVLKEIDRLGYAEYLTFNVGENRESVEEQNYYKIDVSIQAKNLVANGSLYFPEAFRNEWKKHFSQHYKFFLSDDLKRKMEVDIGLEIGYSELEASDLKKVQLGDFIILDHSTYDVEKKEGSVVLTINGEAIFRGKLKSDGIKLLEFPKLDEARKNMDTEENFESESEADAFLAELPSEKGGASLEKLPVQIVVEVGRIKMTLEELSNLSPGSILELPINVEEGVDLVINGKKMWKGDLVKIGQTLGVKITSL